MRKEGYVYHLVMIAMSFKDLLIWQKGMQIAAAVFQITKQFPAAELYGMVSQMRRCGVSIPSNIAEGSQRSTQKDFANFILISRGSLAELETQILLSITFGYLTKKDVGSLLSSIEELNRMLHAFHSKLKSHVS